MSIPDQFEEAEFIDDEAMLAGDTEPEETAQSLTEADKLIVRRRIEILRERRCFHQTVCLADGHCICHEAIPVDQ